MKFLKDISLYLGIFVLSTFLCAVVGVTGLSYFAVNELAKATAPEPQKIQTPDDADPNLKSLVKIGSNYRNELEVFDRMFSKIAQSKYPEFCTVLCNPSYLDKERMKMERSQYLAEYYQKQGARALEDPGFRMKLAEVEFISRLFPPSLRDILGEIEGLHNGGKESSSRLVLAVKLETAVLTEMSSLTLKLDSMKGEADKFRDIRDLIHSCQKGTMTHKSVRSQCESILSI